MRAFKFIVGGGVNFAISYGAYLVLLMIAPTMVAYSISYGLGICVSYIINSKFVFGASFSRRTASLFPLIYVAQYLVGLATIAALERWAGVSAAAAGLGAVIVGAVLSYSLMKLLFVGSTPADASAWESHKLLLALNKLIGHPVFAISFLGLCNLWIFYNHWEGTNIFPDDFLLGYHATEFAFYADNNIFSLVPWVPYGNAGYPLSLSIQSGGFYLPHYILHWLNIPYTFENATRFQLLHTWVGGIGAFIFFRRHFSTPGIALIGAVAYMTSAVFISNQQHVDIIRGATWLPWCLAFSSSKWLSDRLFTSVGLLALVGSLFFLGGYPGGIIATGLLVLVYCAFEMVSLNDSLRRRYLLSLGAGWILAALAATVKYAPPLMQSSEILRMASDVSQYVTTEPRYLLTLFLPYGNDKAFGGDPALRALYIGGVVFAGLFFVGSVPRGRISRLPREIWLGLILSVLFLVLTIHYEPWMRIVALLPLQDISRMRLLDYRPLLTIGLLFIGCSGLERALRYEKLPVSALIKGATAIVAVAIMAMAGLELGMTLNEVAVGTFPVLAALLLMVFASRLPDEWRVIPLAGLLAISLFSAHSYYRWPEHLRSWSFGDPNYLVKVMGMDLQKELFETRRRTWPERPARIVLGSDVSRHKVNRGYYDQDFYLDGHDGALRLVRNRRLRSLLASGDVNWLGGFLAAPSRTIIFGANDEPRIDDLIGCDEPKKCSQPNQGTVQITEFRQDSATFAVDLTKPSLVVENELYFPGWEAQICKTVCEKHLQAEPIGNVLRGWRLPAGKYTLRTQFVDPFLTLTYKITLGAHLLILILLGIGGGLLIWKRVLQRKCYLKSVLNNSKHF